MDPEKGMLDSFAARVYPWIKISRYSQDETGMLIYYGGEESPVYWCLYEGWWENIDACGISEERISNARPISIREAREIIQKEARPRNQRPVDRNIRMDV